MTRRSRIWLVAAVLFAVINFAGAVIAAAQGEALHAGTHVALFVLGTYVALRLVPALDARRIRRRGSSAPPPAGELADRLTRLELAIDAVAIEIERIGEGQRFLTRRFAEHAAPSASGERAAEPIEAGAREAAARERRR